MKLRSERIKDEKHLSLIITDFYEIANDEKLNLDQQQSQLESETS